MDAAWKVYVGDRRFDDNQISNLFLKLKYETVGRFTFDFRPIDGDESYMVVNNTLRIFWGDLHKLDGVIQRVDWDDTQYCYHVFGADIRGFLLDRVNTEPSTVSSYTSDITSTLMYEGCDFPSNIWTGAGEKIGTYTFHYKLGIQNTIRITSATRNIWHTIVERGTVYDHVNGCLYDATKNWATNAFAGATLRFVSGACKNNVYNINGNTSNRVCIRLPGEPASKYTSGGTIEYIEYGTQTFRNWVVNGQFASSLDPWTFQPASYQGTLAVGATARIETGAGTDGGDCLYMNSGKRVFNTYTKTQLSQVPGTTLGTPASVGIWYKVRRDSLYLLPQLYLNTGLQSVGYGLPIANNAYTNPSWPDWDRFETTHNYGITDTTTFVIFLQESGAEQLGPFGMEVWIDGAYVIDTSTPTTRTAFGTIPGCSRLGDIYEIVTASMERIEPASLTPATLEKDNHIVKYNQTDELPDHPTVVTVTGTGDTPPSNTISFSVIAVGAAITQSVIDAALAQVPRDIWSFHPGPTAEEGVNWQKGSVYFSDPAVGDLPMPLQDFTICISDPNDFEDLGDSYGSTHTGTHRCGVWNIPGIVDGTVLHELLHTTSAVFLHTAAEQLADAGFMKWLATAHPTYGSAEVTANYGTLCNEYALYTYRNG